MSKNQNSELFVNPQQLNAIAADFKMLASQIDGILTNASTTMAQTQSVYESESGEAMREQFRSLKGQLDQFNNYLVKVANYLVQNVAEPAKVVEQVAKSNVAAIKKPH